jgi:hypothetical protein
MRRRANRPELIGIVSFHLQRGAVLSIEPVPPGQWSYRGGKDADWRVVARVGTGRSSGRAASAARCSS